jgi:hypothetical protein
MRERLRELNGKLEINSGGFGTSLRAIVPLSVKHEPVPVLNHIPAFPVAAVAGLHRASL